MNAESTKVEFFLILSINYLFLKIYLRINKIIYVQNICPEISWTIIFAKFVKYASKRTRMKESIKTNYK